uniref:Uncharacterized protein n=1 Tax=Taeniopygia guttata TaxID=59729 RepID=A0A674HE17_TAEGU
SPPVPAPEEMPLEREVQLGTSLPGARCAQRAPGAGRGARPGHPCPGTDGWIQLGSGKSQGKWFFNLNLVKTLMFVKQRNRTFKMEDLFNVINQNTFLKTVKLNISTFSSSPYTRIYQPYLFNRADRNLLSNSTDQNLHFSGERDLTESCLPVLFSKVKAKTISRCAEHLK